MKKSRPIDRTKKSNIKCEHCKYWSKNVKVKSGEYSYEYIVCDNADSPKHDEATWYYQRCKSFEWLESEE